MFEVVLGEGVALVVPEPGGDPPGGPGFQVPQRLVVTAPAKPPQRQVFLAPAQHLPSRRVEIVQGEGSRSSVPVGISGGMRIAGVPGGAPGMRNAAERRTPVSRPASASNTAASGSDSRRPPGTGAVGLPPCPGQLPAGRQRPGSASPGSPQHHRLTGGRSARRGNSGPPPWRAQSIGYR